MVKRCRNIVTNTPKLRFCKQCMEYAKKFKVEEEMRRQAREGLWICPNAMPECGKKVEDV